MRTADERVADYTLALDWLTGVLAISTLGLWIATHLTLRHSRQTAERQLRAYVVQRHSTLYDILKVPKINLVIKNTGLTPAYNVVTWAKVWIGPFPPDGWRPPDPEMPNDKTSAIIGPGEEENSLTFGEPLSQQQQLRIARGKAALFVYGCVTYHDAFGAARWTRFHLFSSVESAEREVHGGGMSTYRHEAN